MNVIFYNEKWTDIWLYNFYIAIRIKIRSETGCSTQNLNIVRLFRVETNQLIDFSIGCVTEFCYPIPAIIVAFR